MSPECHYCVWFDIAEYRSEYQSQFGMQKYLDYCNQNGITWELLSRENSYDGMDVMMLYDKQVVKASKEKHSKDFTR